MRKAVGLVLSGAVACALALGVPGVAQAESIPGATWSVTFTQQEKMDESWKNLSQEYVDVLQQLQPGDDVTLTVKVKHDHSTAADWYMENTVIKTLEEQAANDQAAGSAYTYILSYDGPGTAHDRTLYSSEMVGGDDSEGMHEATDALEDYLYLDNLAKGQEGTVTLKVAMDGETEGNAYFDTMARLKMRFAVELNGTGSGTPGGGSSRTKLVKTGDATRLFPLYVAMAVSGLGLLVLALLGIRDRRRERQEVAR